MMKTLLFCSLALVLAGPASAQSPTRVRGVIESLDGDTLHVKAADKSMAIKLAPNFAVAATVKNSPADIKAGNFIAVGARPQADGSLKAIQVVIYPESLRGAGEGHRDWAAMPETTMTNGTVADHVSAVSGPVVTLKYKDGEKKVVVGPDANILGLEPATKADVKAGVDVAVFASKAADGALSASRLTIGKNGVAPPM